MYGSVQSNNSTLNQSRDCTVYRIPLHILFGFLFACLFSEGLNVTETKISFHLTQTRKPPKVRVHKLRPFYVKSTRWKPRNGKLARFQPFEKNRQIAVCYADVLSGARIFLWSFVWQVLILGLKLGGEGKQINRFILGHVFIG